MPEFETSYDLKGGRYSTSLFALDEDEAVRMISERGIGEALKGPRDPFKKATLTSEWIDLAITYEHSARAVNTTEAHRTMEQLEADKCWKQALHAACWLGHHAVKTGYDAGKLLDDDGLIHELAHMVIFPRGDGARPKYAKILEIARKVEAATPGMVRK